MIINPNLNPAEFLNNWDYWGPLLILLLIIIPLAATSDNHPVVSFFGISFVIALGTFLIALSLISIGCNIGFLNCISGLIYCMLPYALSSLISMPFKWFIIRAFINVAAIYFSIKTVLRIFTADIPEGKEYICKYPIFIIYVLIGFAIIFHQ